tara:strand:- start:427 stop:2040 length:1614 start_codon:yes stop_codon:yes gene_type:complete
MMAKFDEEKFRALAAAAGYGKDEIEAEIKLEKAPVGAAVPNIVPIADGRQTTAAFEKEAQTKGAELITSANQEQEATLAAPPFDFMKALNSPVGYVTGGAAIAALTAGAGYAFGKAKSGLSGINQRKIGQQPIDRTIDIPMDTVEKRNMSPFAQQFETTYGVPLSKAEAITGGPITNPKDAAIIGGALKNQAGISVNNPYQISPYTPAPIPFELDEYSKSGMITGQQPKAPIAPTDPLAPRPNPYITPSVQEGVATGNTAQAVQTVVAKELDKATGVAPTLATFNRDANGNIQYPKGMSPAARQGAEAFAQQYPDNAKALASEGRFGILGAGSGDNNLFNSYGSDMMKRIRDEVNQGQMVGPYANYETKVNPAIKAISPETALGKELADLRASQTGGNFGPLGTPASIGGKKGGLIQGTNMVAKAVKAGGPAALLMSIADAANAAQQGRYGEAAIRSADVATDYIPMIAQLKQGLSPTSAGEGSTLSAEQVQQVKNVNLLGSPYAQTEQAKKLREQEAYARKVGAGRGVAPPSAYIR